MKTGAECAVVQAGTAPITPSAATVTAAAVSQVRALVSTAASADQASATTTTGSSRNSRVTDRREWPSESSIPSATSSKMPPATIGTAADGATGQSRKPLGHRTISSTAAITAPAADATA